MRRGSKDLGSTTLEGSRPGMAMLIHSGLKIIAKDGYEILIDQGINKAKAFAKMIDADSDFEIISYPELNIITYRYNPEFVQQALLNADDIQMAKINEVLDRVTKSIQKTQREKGLSFVSRTRLEPTKYHQNPCVVFRVVLANPLTTLETLKDILIEQKEIANQTPEIQSVLKRLKTSGR